jgi:hypothetical protein
VPLPPIASRASAARARRLDAARRGAAAWRRAADSDDAWILGVEIDGEARAYSLNLLNSHEVVNDRIGERSFAAVW